MAEILRAHDRALGIGPHLCAAHDVVRVHADAAGLPARAVEEREIALALDDEAWLVVGEDLLRAGREVDATERARRLAQRLPQARALRETGNGRFRVFKRLPPAHRCRWRRR